MNLLTQYQDLLSAKRMLEGRMLSIAEAQFALDREAYFTVFPDEKGKQFSPAYHFNAKINDFRINDEGKCEAWEYGRCGNPDEAIYEFDIDLSLEHATDIELLKMEEPKCWTAYKNKRIEAYTTVKAEREAAAAAELARKRASLEAQLAALQA
jgi:hypothetical protein